MYPVDIHGIDPGRVKAAVFDLGGVFLAGSVENVAQFGVRMGLTTETWAGMRQELFLDDGWWDRVERAEMPLDEFAAELCRRLAEHDIALTIAQARNFMGSPGHEGSMPLRTEIVAAAAEVHRVMPTVLLTNNVAEWRGGWHRRLDLDALFDVVIDSSEVGLRKPEEAIYTLTEKEIGIDGKGLFFLDDLGMNLKPARRRGWQTLKYVETEPVLEVLSALAHSRPPRDGAGINS
ncbi:MAG: HAD family phosphatase [SAR324 cluster bacterium]|nr:HAD family phosphatase [SAR324 cluster bacterium]